MTVPEIDSSLVQETKGQQLETFKAGTVMTLGTYRNAVRMHASTMMKMIVQRSSRTSILDLLL